MEKLRRKRAVFFGDGSSSSCARGSCPIAKKAFLKLSSARGVTVYNDEFNTSKMCPCGTDELITITGSDKCSRIPQPKAAVRIPPGFHDVTRHYRPSAPVPLEGLMVIDLTEMSWQLTTCCIVLRMH